MNDKVNTRKDLQQDPRFIKALSLFNSADWYTAHDVLEEIWHETNGPERKTIQGLLQIAVAQLHLERGNGTGATLLFGEGLGRLRSLEVPDLGLDIEALCICIEDRLRKLQMKSDVDTSIALKLEKRTRGSV